MFYVTALATAAATPFELSMMQSASPAEFGQALRWYHLPIFFTLIGQLLFVRYYLGAGRLWIVWTFIPARLFVLAADFIADPNFNFSAIAKLDRISFLGERVAVVGDGTPRSWQWIGSATMVLLFAFIIDAAFVAWRRNSIESRRKAIVILLAIVVPMTANLLVNQL